MLTCKDIPGVASDYVSHEGGRKSRLLIGLHLLQCTNCRAYVRSLKNLRSLAAASFRAEAVPTDLFERLNLRSNSHNTSIGEQN
nr:hypothetical protein [uncultured Gellertiella sp.]